MSDLEVPEDFIEENKNNLCQFMPKSRKSGPYPKQNSKFNGIVPYCSIKTICRILGIDNAS